MGNHFSNGGLHVYTEKPAYLPGESVRGTVYMNVLQPITSRGVFITVTGREKVKWTWKETRWEGEGEDRKATYHYHPRHGRSEFFKMKVPLYQAAGQLFPGNYEFPFAFDLPQGLPGVFHKNLHHAPGDNSEVHASIEYKIKGTCDVAGGKDLKHKHNFILNERLTKHIVGVSKYGHSKVTQCCCLDKGEASLTVRMDKNAYAPGETIQAVCEVDNNSSIDMTKISVKLHRTLHLNTHNGHHIDVHELVSRADFPGVPKGTKYVGQQARYVPLQIDGQIEPETHGKHIKCTYHAEVNLDVPYGSDICVKLPVAVYAPAPPMTQWEQMRSQLPPQWAPQVMGTVNLGALPLGVPPPVTPQSWADPFGGATAPPSTYATPSAPLLANAYGTGGAPPSSTGMV